jgi:ATP-binding cassette subfamily F protein 3
VVLASLNRVSKSFAGDSIFENISLQIKSGDRIALIGRNGVGKTTVFRIIMGEMGYDSGELIKPKYVTAGYLPQEVKTDTAKTLYDEVEDAFRDLIVMKRRIDELQKVISSNSAQKAHLNEYGKLQENYERLGGFTYQSRIEEVLTGLGFRPDEFAKSLSLFSGGEKSRAYLAKLLLAKPDILLLDEPTNHLDIQSTEWLEEYLNDVDSAVVIVSHDRVFLNNTTRITCDMKFNRIDTYSGNFDYYLKERELRSDLQLKAYERQTEEIRRIQDFIQRNIAGQKTKQAQSRRKMLSKLKRLAPPDSEMDAAAVKMESSGRSYRKILDVRDVSKSFHGRRVFSDLSFLIERGDKIGLIGPNGSGKSTLLKIITGELEPDSGEVTIGGNVRPAYFDQDLSILDDRDTVLDSVWEEKPDAEARELRSYLGKYLFSGDEVFKTVLSLSGGEKSRLALAKILLLPANFLILDEPTNHLDIPSCERLEEALRNYDGACLVVSHDRFFLEKTVGKILSLDDGSLSVYPGKYSEFVAWKNRQSVKVESPDLRAELNRRKESRLKDWEGLKEKRRARKQFEKLERDIHTTEAEIARTEEMLRDEKYKSDWVKLHELQALKAELESRLDELLKQYDEFDHE